MNHLARSLLLAVGFGLAAPALAAEDKPKAAAKATDQLHCFSEKKTGSNLRRRICITAEEQERRRKEDQQAVSNVRRSTGAAGASRGDPSLR